VAKRTEIVLPDDVWKSVAVALLDYLTFGPAELDAEHIPDKHLEIARKAIHMATGVPPDAD
jgi:hypothetical protein